MRVFKSLTAKYALISLMILSILSIFVYASLDFTRHMAGEATSINMTGNLRFRSYQMAWDAHRFAEAAFSPEGRARSQADIARHLQEFDQIVRGIETGTGGRSTKPINHYPEAVALFGDLKKEWEHDLKPPLVKIVSLPHDVPEVAARELLLDFDKRLPEFVNRANDLVAVLELHYDEEIRAFARQRLLIVTIFIFIAFIVALYFRKKIVIPMKLLTRSALRLKSGDFDVQAPIQGDDEVGTLSDVFNGMARGLKELFAAESKKLREFATLNTISRAAGETLAVDAMAGKIIDAILDLEPLALEKKGAIFISDRNKKTLELVVARNFGEEQVGGCGRIRYGECLCGVAAELEAIVLSDNNVHDSRHTRIYADAKEHGHIILPLKSRNSLIGILCLYLPPEKKPSVEDQRLYESIADIIAVALQNAINHRQVAMLAQSLDSSNDMVIITDKEGNIVHVNPEVARDIGYTLTELIGQPASLTQSHHIPPGLGEAIIADTVKDGGWRGEIIFRRKDGSEFPALLTTSLVRAEDGQVLALVGIARNITDSKLAETALRASEDKYRTLIEEINDGIFVMDARGTFTFANSALARIHGYEKPEDLVGMNFLELPPPEEREALRQDFIRNMASGRAPGLIDIPIVKPDRSWGYIQVHSVNIVENGRVVGTRGIVRDITERKHFEDALVNSEARLKSIVDNAPEIIYLKDLDGRYLLVNNRWESLFALNMESVIGKTAHEVFPQRIADAFRSNEREVVEKRTAATFEEVIPHADGLHTYISNRFPLLDPTGAPYAICGISTDITERKRIESFLRLYEHIVSASTDHLAFIDKDLVYRAVNDRYPEFFGRDKMAILGHGVHELLPAELFESTAKPNLERCLAGEIVRYQAWLVFPAAGRRFMDVIYSPYRGVGGDVAGVVVSSRDITEQRMSQDSLVKSETRLREAQRITRLGSWEWDLVGDKLHWSDEVYRVFGLTPQESGATYQVILSLVHPDDRNAVANAVTASLESGEAYGIDHRIVLPDGTTRTVHEQAEVAYDGTGKAVRMTGTVQDITERTLAEEALKKHRDELLALSEASNTILAAAASVAGRVEELYEYICDIAVVKFGLRMVWLGLVREGDKEVRPVSWAGFEDGFLSHVRVAWDDSPDGMGSIGMAIKTGMPYTVENVEMDPRCVPRKAEALRRGYRSSLAIPLFSSEGRILGALGMYSEEPGHFTKQKSELLHVYCNQAVSAIENALLIVGLEEKIKERTAELENARLSAEAATRAKSEFLANMSHELRTPLNAILGFSEIMRDGLAGEVNPQQKEYLSDVWESGSHLLRLINDILDISKIEAGKMVLEIGAIDFTTLLGETLVLFQEKATRHGIRLHGKVAEGLPAISADERKIKQVLINLLSNALKFTPDGGEVGVSVAREGGDILVSVRDTGIGIAPEDLDRLFQPFQQLESALTKRHEGTGLGLNLCRKIVELHGGRIWIESTPGQGSRFAFTIPIAAAAGKAS